LKYLIINMAANEEIKVVISAENKTGGAFNNVGDGLGRLKGLAAGLATTLGVSLAGAFAAATSFAKASFDAFVEAEKEMAIANKALSNSLDKLSGDDLVNLKNQLGVTTDLMAGLKEKMSEVGKSAIKLAFDDEAASLAFAKLFQVTKDAKQAQEDVKLAMDLAAFSGRSLEEATSALMKVHAGGTRILKEFGIAVQEGTSVEDALALTHDKVRGAAETMANTTAGKLEQLSIVWTNLKEDVGAAVAEGITPFITELTNWISSDQTQSVIMGISEQLKNLSKELSPKLVQEILPAFIKVLGASIIIAGEFTKGFLAVADVLGTVIFKVQQAIDWFKQLIDKIGEALNKIREFAKESAGGILSGLSSFVAPTVAPLLKALPKFQNGGFINAPFGAAVPAILHGGETVIPAGVGIGGITLNINGGMYLDEDAAEKFGDKLIKILKQNLRV